MVLAIAFAGFVGSLLGEIISARRGFAHGAGLIMAGLWAIVAVAVLVMGAPR